MQHRRATIKRITSETRITATLDLDGSGKGSVRTGLPFLDHMLTLFARHAVVDLTLRCRGDLEVDAHHTVEDCGLVLGQALAQALGDKRGLRRYGFAIAHPSPSAVETYVPMDETLVRCVLDLSGRPFLVWRGMDKLALRQVPPGERPGHDIAPASPRRAEFIPQPGERRGRDIAPASPRRAEFIPQPGERCGHDMALAFRFGLAREFFQAFVNEARCNLHLELLYGQEPHHVVEAVFKAFAKALDAACQRDPRLGGQLPSTKGLL